MIATTPTGHFAPGVGLHLELPLPPDLPRIHLSTGTGSWRESESGRKRVHEEDAILPRQPWRSPNPAESEVLRGAPEHAAWFVRVGACPAAWGNELAALDAVNDAATPEDGKALLAAPPLVGGIERLNQRIGEDMGVSEGLVFHKPYVRDLPNMQTLTPNHSGALLGLHMDAWEWEPGRDETEFRWRMSINLGRQERYFLFLNLTPAQLRVTVHDRLGYPPTVINGTTLGRLFCRHFPDYPIVRVAVRPGEFYMAPTENIVHDGATPATSVRDVHLTWRGHFRRAL